MITFDGQIAEHSSRKREEAAALLADLIEVSSLAVLPHERLRGR